LNARLVLPVALGLALPPLASAQESIVLDGTPALSISNDRLSLAIRSVGGAMVNLLLRDDPHQIDPLHSRYGHYVCVDGFGGVSPEERSAGLPGHGEANRVPWELVSSRREAGTLTLSFSATLPIVQEVFRRTIHLVDGENVVYVESELESLLGFDRPVNWAEHGTIGPPFLELGTTLVEMSATRAMTRDHATQGGTMPRRLASFQEFTWPMAPAIDGSLIDMRRPPTTTPSRDHTTSLMDPSRELVYLVALNPERRLLFGYVFRRVEYPWTQMWEYYPDDGALARGMEFAVQPFDLPRRQVIDMNTLLGAPTYRWLPAKSTIGSAFLMFYTQTPDGMQNVDEVVLVDGQLRIHDRTSGQTITLAASRGL
jgi:hypothetical protein